MEEKKKPNAFSYFTLGFSTAVLLFEILTLVLKW